MDYKPSKFGTPTSGSHCAEVSIFIISLSFACLREKGIMLAIHSQRWGSHPNIRPLYCLQRSRWRFGQGVFPIAGLQFINLGEW